MATIRVLAPASLFDQSAAGLFVAVNGRSVVEQAVDRIVFGHWGAPAAAEDVVLCRVAEQLTEIHCHGGDVASRRILGDLERVGCQIVPWQDLAMPQECGLDAECREVLTQAPTLRTASILLKQASGILHQAVNELRLSLAAGQQSAVLRQLAELWRWAEFGRHLTTPWQVVILGRPNVGKSSLMNALAGFERAIVFDQPGTTRDVITADIALEGWPVTLLDTAGLRSTDSRLEAAGIELAQAQARAADLRLVVLDRSQPPEATDLELLQSWPDALIVANKCDLPDAWGAKLPGNAHGISALCGEAVDQLAESIVQALVSEQPLAGQAIPVHPRQVAFVDRAQAAALNGDWPACGLALKQLLRGSEPEPPSR
ncbi:MAG: 50S ribosome-binding GTPase [Planctomycetes bacterium]|nr:50S ribosome-binding GTPase [Planctomycetota bacterium]